MEIKKKSEYIWEIPKTGKMKVPALVYASKNLIEKIQQDKTLEQAQNVACLPGIQKASYTMPDAHQGYGFPIGGVAAFDLDEGIISPGGVGYDINCGVRLLATALTERDVTEKRRAILNEVFNNVPAGVGKKGITKLSRDVLKELLVNGAKWALNNGYGKKDDLTRTEEYGCMKGANPEKVSERALQRGMPQLGTLGSGNHFLEIQKVDKIFDKKIANKFGIKEEGQITVMIHCGSRGLGHQVCSDYIREMEQKIGIKGLPDRELVNAPVKSKLGEDYLEAMACAINFAFANRQMIAHWTRESFNKIFGDVKIEQVYDVCHNLAKIEEHTIDNERKSVCVHRKGATRSFGPGRKEIPDVYQDTGQPVLIPGSMGTSSSILVGTKKAEEISFGSTAHGAGRVMSRNEALRRFRGEQIASELQKKGVEVKATSWSGIAEEASQAYKDVDEVVKVSHELGIGNLVARVVPIGVMKG